jgi:hypothetical protein
MFDVVIHSTYRKNTVPSIVCPDDCLSSLLTVTTVNIHFNISLLFVVVLPLCDTVVELTIAPFGHIADDSTTNVPAQSLHITCVAPRNSNVACVL